MLKVDKGSSYRGATLREPSRPLEAPPRNVKLVSFIPVRGRESQVRDWSARGESFVLAWCNWWETSWARGPTSVRGEINETNGTSRKWSDSHPHKVRQFVETHSGVQVPSQEKSFSVW